MLHAQGGRPAKVGRLLRVVSGMLAPSSCSDPEQPSDRLAHNGAASLRCGQAYSCKDLWKKKRCTKFNPCLRKTLQKKSLVRSHLPPSLRSHHYLRASVHTPGPHAAHQINFEVGALKKFLRKSKSKNMFLDAMREKLLVGPCALLLRLLMLLLLLLPYDSLTSVHGPRVAPLCARRSRVCASARSDRSRCTRTSAALS